MSLIKSQNDGLTDSLVDISVVIPVYNEEAILPALFSRLYMVMDNLNRAYEIVFVDDGSKDKSRQLLAKQYQQRPDVTNVVELRANAGQHAAIIAGFATCRGRYVVTMDADMQNPPEEIHKLIAKMDDGFDYVGGVRDQRRDAKWRDWASRLMNNVRERITGIHMQDQGCMFRAYHRDIIKVLVDSNESQTFIPALAYLYAARPTEVVVEHRERVAGTSKYSPFKLLHLSLDLITSFSIVPLQIFSLVGMVLSSLSFLLAVFMVVRRFIVGPEVEGVFTLFAIAFFLLGLLLFAVGIVGEYIGRIYSEVRQRPRYIVANTLRSRAKTKLQPVETGKSQLLQQNNVVLFAYSNVGVRGLAALLANGFNVVLVVTHADNPSESIWFDSVADLATLNNIPVIMPTEVNTPEVVRQIQALNPDWFFSFY